MLNFMAKNNISATFTLSTENIEWPTIKTEQQNDLIAMEVSQENKKLPENNTKSEKVENIVSEDVVATTEEKDPLLD
jgi:hypothetical protein